MGSRSSSRIRRISLVSSLVVLLVTLVVIAHSGSGGVQAAAGASSANAGAALPARVGRPAMPPPAAAGPDPVKVAIAWLQAYRTLRYDEPPDAWVARVRAVVSAELAAVYGAGRFGSAGQAWQDWVAQRCDAAVENPTAVIPAEAPRTADEVDVQVSATLRNYCAAPAAENAGVPAPAEAVSVTLVLDRGPDRFWRVRSRLF